MYLSEPKSIPDDTLKKCKIKHNPDKVFQDALIWIMFYFRNQNVKDTTAYL